MTYVTVVFNDEAGEPTPEWGAQGMQVGIDDIPTNNREDALSHVFSAFAAYDYSISDKPFDTVTFKYALANGEQQEEKFTRDELKKKQNEFFVRF